MSLWRVFILSTTSTSQRAGRKLALAGLVCLVAAVMSADCSGTSSAQDPAAAAATGGRGGRGGRGGGRGAAGGAQPVVTTKVTQRDVPVDIAAVGNVEAYSSVSVRSQVTGQLQEAFFHEGDIVKKGAKLFTIDARPLEGTLQQAQANLTRDQALLNQSEAQLARDTANAEYTQATADRTAALAASGLASKEAAEQSKAAATAAQATIKADRAAVESAKAQLTVQQAVVDNAKVQLSFTTIRATIDGRTGNNTVKVGNLVSANSTELVTIAQLQPVYVTFAVPATNLPSIKKIATGETLPVVASPQDGNPEAVDGKLTFVDNLVDTTTDTIKLKATFPNKDLRLWPGQFTRISVRMSMLHEATVIPSQAVQVGQDGQFVFVVKADSTVEQRPVTLAQRVGEIVVIDKGLTPGETIVTEGQLRLEQGTKVQAVDSNGTPAEGGRGRGGRGRGGEGGGGAGGRGGEGRGGDRGGQGAPGGRGDGRGGD